MLTQIIFYQLLDLPLIVWGGLFTMGMFIFAAIIGYLNSKGGVKPPLITYNGRITIAFIALTSGILHGILEILAFI